MSSNREFIRLGLILTVWGSTLVLEGVSITTTVYVGGHFEVRDHDQPTKYIFNGATRVAEITGSLSSNNRLQRLRVHPGWNLISMAVTAQNLLDQCEHNQPGAIQAAYQSSPSNAGYSLVSSGQTVAAGSVLWVESATDAMLGIVGAYADPLSAQVPAGGAYMASSGLESWSPSFPNTSSGWLYSSDARRWQEDFPTSLTSISDPALIIAPGEAFYVQTDSAFDLAIPDPTLRVRYYHQDHLGSSSVITDATGQLVEATAFYPFGGARETDQPRQIAEPYGFTQKETDKESNLQYFEARFLTSALSRFLSADPKFANPDHLSQQEFFAYTGQPQKINVYAYALNNPLRFTDPHGLDTWGAKVTGEVSMGADVSVGVGVVSYGDHWYSHLNPLNLGVCGSFDVGAGTPGASLSVELNNNKGGRDDYEGRSKAYGWSAGEGVVVSGSYSTGSGKPTGSVAVGVGIGPTPVGGSYKHSRTSCVTGGDVVMKVGEGIWSVVPRRLRPWTANEDKAHELELQTQKLEKETEERLEQVRRIQASNDEQLRRIDEKLQFAQQLLDAKDREVQQRRKK